jgi:regulator of replication initiation timing|tara:strand:- start:4 stop:318 length:315 start_codon:yes stop_codon:yes gene_type:complete
MLASETDKLLATRLDTLEEGVSVLDNRVAALDDKVSHVIQMNSELMIQSNENFREMRSTLDEHKKELKKSIRQIKGRFTSQCQLVMFGTGLAAWTIFVAWVMWS